MTVGLLKNIFQHYHILQHSNPNIQELLYKHRPLFHSIGKLKGWEVKLEIDENILPIAQRARRTPNSMKLKVNEKLKEMREQDIIQKAEAAAPWLLLLIAIPKKSGDIRLVLDMRVAYKALKKQRVQIPPEKAILHKMQGASGFTEVDLLQG